jgi:DNA-binding IclR family transcriptional regulator
MTVLWCFLASYCATELAWTVRRRYGQRTEMAVFTSCCVAIALSGAPGALYGALGMLTSYMLLRWLVLRC